jgi:histidyl-tRNA synthetase
MTGTRNIKRFQIGKVYRRDQPAIDRGRMREFYQCDYDYAGVYDLMVADSEVLCVAAEVFEAFDLEVMIKINHRLILDGIFGAVGVSATLTRPISSAVDKLDKLPWNEVKKEIEQKGLEPEISDKVGAAYVVPLKERTFEETLQFLRADDVLSQNEQVKTGVAEMDLLLRHLAASDIAQYVEFDLSLAQGLDYYTGLIYEVVPNDTSLKVGSIVAGGRYDNLVGMFAKRDIPCVGISFGIDRILTILKSRSNKSKPASKIDAWIVACGSSLLVEEKISIARQLRKAGYNVDFDPKVNRKPQKQLDLAEPDGARVAIVVEDNAFTSGSVGIKFLPVPSKIADGGVVTNRASLLEQIQQALS